MGGGGDSCDAGDCWVPRPACPADVTLVLVGKVGSGKSATANSILGRKAFASEYSYGSVTETCQMESTMIRDGCATRTVNVIDTPGLFNMERKIEDSREDIIKCMDMARDGMHAILMVVSATSRFSREDEKTIKAIKMFFGDTIIDHLILVFTNGDRIGVDNWMKMLTDDNCPKYLQDVLKQCKNRAILFDNVTNNQQKCDAQLKKLLDMVDSVVSSKCGKAFSNLMFAHIKVHELEKIHPLWTFLGTFRELVTVNSVCASCQKDSEARISNMVDQEK
ncbi:immune-associated nucleotide-binding protein 7-like [Panicum virgatum]|uniref:immune-associated nucleotide-binding protein 7-like n=1 Tax=Panicum virgatum TaxID=38727 RepID=UPI0019D60EF3|nr:immune-associated nucleotide-binding protein 7-like [Panicum virgatum]